MNYDAVVVGGGFAGLTAANIIAQHEKQVVVLEAGASNLYFCNSRIATGALHIAFRHPTDEPDELFEEIVRTSGDTADESLVRAFVSELRDTFEWLKSIGAQFEQHPRRQNPIPMLAPLREMRAGLDWENSGPNSLLNSLVSNLKSKGGSILLNARVKSLDCDQGSIAGVNYETPKGQKHLVKAKNVIIADGGFQANLDLVAKYIQPKSDQLCQRNAGTGSGDGLSMAIELGAATTGMNTFYGHVLSRDALTNDQLWPYPQLDIMCGDGVVLQPNGKRFTDEGLGGVFLANEIAGLEDPAGATLIIDQEIWDSARETDLVPPNPSLQDNGGTIFTADTIEELANQAGLKPEATASTIRAYNEAIVHQSEHRLTPKRTTKHQIAKKIAKPPFHAIPLCSGITVTSGGLKIDPQARVLDQNGTIISGLYAVGSSAGGLEGGPRASYLGGLMKAFVLGRIAGKSVQMQN